ncbi:MAG TPA: Flp1 family type IVb pilin [Pseudobdellovibrionaceae bacterium]|nr:Flp1 family type IVb pilin [Pseudobdellovibrionaceae bacterium]
MSFYQRLKSIWKDESAQGSLELILILIALVSVALIFKDRIKEFVSGNLDKLGGGLQQFNVEK